MQAFLPSYDPLIERKYSIGNIDLKIQNKTALQKSLGWAQEPRRPLLCLPSGMTDKLGGELFAQVLPGLLSLQMELIVLGKGPAKYGALFTKLMNEQHYRIHIAAEDEKNIHRMYAAADMALFLADPSSSPELQHCLQYGVVPVSAPASTLDDYDPIQETGNSFLSSSTNKWNIFASIVRAVETYKFPFDWRTIQRHCMETASVKQRKAA